MPLLEYFSACVLLAGAYWGPIVQDDVHDEVKKLVDRLGAEDIASRLDASDQLKRIGIKALPGLKAASQSGDKEMSTRAQAVINWIILDQKLTPRLKSAFPGIVDRLVRADAHQWTRALMKALPLANSLDRNKALDKDDLVALVPKAVGGARTKEEKLLVCDVAVDLTVRDAIEALKVLLGDPNLDVRAQSATALGKLGATEAVGELIALLSDPQPSVRVSAIDALRLLRAEQSFPQVGKLLEDGDDSVRMSALRLFIAHPSLAEIPRLAVLLTDYHSTVVVLAKEAIQKLNREDVLSRVALLLDADDPRSRRGACQTLALLGATAQLPEVGKLLRDKEALVRQSAVIAVIELDGEQFTPTLRALMNDSDSRVKSLAIIGLSRFRVKESIQAITERLDDDSADIRETAAYALGRLGAREACSKLMGHLRDPSRPVRFRAIEALAMLGHEPAAPILMALAEDDLAVKPKWGMGSEAVRALGVLECSEAIHVLERVLKDSKYMPVKIAAANSLCRLRSTKGIPLLLDAAQASNDNMFSLFDLNAVSSPEMWDTLGQETIQLHASLPLRALISNLKKAIGARLVFRVSESDLEGLDSVVGLEFQITDGKVSVRHALKKLHVYGIHTVFRDKGIEIVSRKAALRHWKDWASRTQSDVQQRPSRDK